MSIFEKIKSKYIRDLPFQYLTENFLYKLVNYSKKSQTTFGLTLSDYKQKYFNHFEFDVDKKYLSFIDWELDDYFSYPSYYNKNSLKNNLEKDMKIYNLNIDSFQKYVINYIKKYIQKKKINEGNILVFKYKFIDIFSPFIEVFSKDDLYKNLFFIPIIFNFIKEQNLIKEYYNFFESIKKSKSIYNSFYFYLDNINDVYNINDLGINFNLIKKLSLYIKSTDRLNSPKNYNETEIFNIFKLNNIENNLTHLIIDAKLNIKSDIFETINNYKYLNYLTLKDIKFDKIFTINLNSLKLLKLIECEKISITQKCANNLKSLYLFSIHLQTDSKLLFPEMESFEYKTFYKNFYLKESVDINSMVKLKELFIDMNVNFLLLKNCDILQIENLTLYSVEININNVIDVLKKIFELKKLKKLLFSIISIDNEMNDELSKLSGQNDSVEKLKIILVGEYDDGILYNYQTKFPNVTNLKIKRECSLEEGSLEIKENKNLKINKIKIAPKGKRNKIYIQSYETLTDVELNFNIYNHNENGFALFNDKCDYIFKSLINLKLDFKGETEIRFINNIFKNIEKTPNLKSFKLSFTCKNVNKQCYEEYIKKLLSLKLKSIELKKRKNKKQKIYDESNSGESDNSEDSGLYYSENELKNLYNDFCLMKYYKILINKFN